MSDKKEKFLDGIKSTNRRTQLETLRDLVAHQLMSTKCRGCESIAMRQSDVASLVLRLQKILEEIDELPVVSTKKTETEMIAERVARKAAGGEIGGNVVYPFGTKEAPRRKGVGRRPTIKGDDD